MELTSTLEASIFQNMPNGPQNAHVTKVDAVDLNTGKIKKTSSGLGNQCSLDWTVDEGEYAGREVRYNNLSLGGHYLDSKTGEKKPLNTSAFCEFLNHTSVPWHCNSCSNSRAPRKFHIGTGDDGVRKGQYVCPDCKNPRLNIGYDTDDFLGARCCIMIGSQKKTTRAADGTRVEDPDKEYNVVKGYLPLRTY